MKGIELKHNIQSGFCPNCGALTQTVLPPGATAAHCTACLPWINVIISTDDAIRKQQDRMKGAIDKLNEIKAQRARGIERSVTEN